MCTDLKKKQTSNNNNSNNSSIKINLDKLLYDYTMAVCQKGAMKEFYNANKTPEKAAEEAVEVNTFRMLAIININLKLLCTDFPSLSNRTDIAS